MVGPAVDNIVAAHIHVGSAGVNGGVVVDLDWTTTGGNGCVDADPATSKQIRQNPSGFYVNVHSRDFPAGAIGGQLSNEFTSRAAAIQSTNGPLVDS